MRSAFSITLDVWRAIFLREALDRLFGMRAAWFWLLIEPIFHIGFIAVVWSLIRRHVASGTDIAVWITIGMLAFFLFRRTGIQVMYAIDCNRPFFVYRQVKPFDTAIVRGALEAFLMAIISMVILLIAALLGHSAVPIDPLLVMIALAGLWLLGLGYGLLASVSMKLVPESEHILNILMLPLYLISGVIWPISSIPEPYRSVLMLNPIVHGLEAVRQGFLPHYHAVTGTSLGYVYATALISILLGLMLYRRFAFTLVMQ
ncbi:MAG TPA: ABC transporter permease [Accumulibacter sp.]|uniref:ABC transporter permease n=1 Tax=Accumulibacter sp. TaxID=2053492 RepID=UPI0025D79C06|nr:ABC transporter permease [Accumulibacter sp.]MCM8597768.1 ABC transporter permease [Accumulibacter sp.]MCM8610702.1 ABC transporter permease [Accumulibacter sp.]HNC52551.1 ABC transporter permease [Accumulibacter sp.]